MTGVDLQDYYRVYDAAVAALPPELRQRAHVTRSLIDNDGTLTLYDEHGRKFAAVDEDGKVTPLSNETKPSAQPKPRPQQPGASKAYVDAALKGVIRAVADRIHELEASLTTKSIGGQGELGAISERLDLIQAQVSDLVEHGIRYRGYWSHGAKAARGDSFTHDGSAWRANRETIDEPGRDSPDWSVFVRKGADAPKGGRNAG